MGIRTEDGHRDEVRTVPPGRRAFIQGAGATLGAMAVLPLLGGEHALAATAEPGRTGGAPAWDADRLFQAGQFAAADAGYARLIRRNRQDAHAWAQRGYIALLGNRFGWAERFLGHAIGLNPADRASAARLADCYVRRDDYARAVPLLLAAGDRVGAALYSVVSGRPFRVGGAGSTSVPFLSLDPLPTVRALVNGREATFVLDTGATFGISARVARDAGISPMRTVMADHGHGPVRSYVSVVRELSLGGIMAGNIPVLWDDSPGQPDGVLGTTIFYHFLSTLDYAGRTLRLSRQRAAGQAAGTQMWLAPDHFVIATGSVGRSGEGLVLLDTAGAGLGIVLTASEAARAGVLPDYRRPGTYLGVPGYPCTAAVTLGDATRRAVPGAVGAFREPPGLGFGTLGTVSHEFVRDLSLTLDFTSMTLSAARA